MGRKSWDVWQLERCSQYLTEAADAFISSVSESKMIRIFAHPERIIAELENTLDLITETVECAKKTTISTEELRDEIDELTSTINLLKKRQSTLQNEVVDLCYSDLSTLTDEDLVMVRKRISDEILDRESRYDAPMVAHQHTDGMPTKTHKTTTSPSCHVDDGGASTMASTVAVASTMSSDGGCM